jgi:glutaredoxin/glutathione-dependent peroxiredoxin
MIKVGDKLPAAELTAMTGDGVQKLSTDVIFGGRKVAVLGVPGAFTPTCSSNHLPGYINSADALRAKGIDSIVCIAVNDVHVMNAWSKATGADGKVMMLADGNGEFSRAVGLENDLTVAGMGKRSKRYSMVVDDGVVTSLNVEQKSGVNVSGADTMVCEL